MMRRIFNRLNLYLGLFATLGGFSGCTYSEGFVQGGDEEFSLKKMFAIPEIMQEEFIRSGLVENVEIGSGEDERFIPDRFWWNFNNGAIAEKNPYYDKF